MQLEKTDKINVLHQRLCDSVTVGTAHAVGVKKILLREGQSTTSVPQIAVAFLRTGDKIETHIHQTMEEFFYCLVGKVEFTIGGDVYVVKASELIVIPMGVKHSLRVLLDTELFYWGVSS